MLAMACCGVDMGYPNQQGNQRGEVGVRSPRLAAAPAHMTMA